MKMKSESQALVTGSLIGWLAKADHLKVLDIVCEQDEHGNYRPYFYLVLPSGTYRIVVDKLKDDEPNGTPGLRDHHE